MSTLSRFSRTLWSIFVTLRQSFASQPRSDRSFLILSFQLLSPCIHSSSVHIFKHVYFLVYMFFFIIQVIFCNLQFYFSARRKSDTAGRFLTFPPRGKIMIPSDSRCRTSAIVVLFCTDCSFPFANCPVFPRGGKTWLLNPLLFPWNFL